MKNVLELSHEKCTGCGACVAVCPENCITMEEDNRGFLFPGINETICTGCTLCISKCPINSQYMPESLFDQPQAYAAWNLNKHIREKSSSGGLFSLFAFKMLQNKGAVCGAGFDKDLELCHTIVDTEIGVRHLQGSKYLQSNTKNVFKDIEKLLKKSQGVLFVGTPCQVAGLQQYLSKQYEKLVTCDLVCHGVPSSKVFRKYIKEIEARRGSRVDGIFFRNKKTGWKRFSVVINFENGEEISSVFLFNKYMRGFLQNIYLRPSCYECSFAKIPRVGDITLGDFWKIGVERPDLDDDKGTSLVLVNTTQGRLFFDTISSDECYSEEVDVALSLPGNRTLTRPTFKNSRREFFFKEIDAKRFQSLIWKFCGPSLIKDYFKSAVHKIVTKI